MQISHQPPATCQCTPPSMNANLASAAVSQTQLAAMSTSRSLDLSLVTAEGDTVTLSWDATAAAMAFQDESMSMDGGGNVRYRQTALSMKSYESDFSLTIEGDLNADEKREIRKVLQVLNRMMGQMANGNTPMGVGDRQSLMGLDTIATLDAQMSYERNVLVANQAQAEMVYNQAGELSDLPDRGATALPTGPPEPAMDTLAREMAGVVHRARAPRAHKLHAVDGLFERHRKRAGFGGEGHHAASNLFEDLRRRFYAAFGEIAGHGIQ